MLSQSSILKYCCIDKKYVQALLAIWPVNVCLCLFITRQCAACFYEGQGLTCRLIASPSHTSIQDHPVQAPLDLQTHSLPGTQIKAKTTSELPLQVRHTLTSQKFELPRWMGVTLPMVHQLHAGKMAQGQPIFQFWSAQSSNKQYNDLEAITASISYCLHSIQIVRFLEEVKHKF